MFPKGIRDRLKSSEAKMKKKNVPELDMTSINSESFTQSSEKNNESTVIQEKKVSGLDDSIDKSEINMASFIAREPGYEMSYPVPYLPVTLYKI